MEVQELLKILPDKDACLQSVVEPGEGGDAIGMKRLYNTLDYRS